MTTDDQLVEAMRAWRAAAAASGNDIHNKKLRQAEHSLWLAYQELLPAEHEATRMDDLLGYVKPEPAPLIRPDQAGPLFRPNKETRP